MEEEREQLKKANATISSLTAEFDRLTNQIKQLHTQLANYKEELASSNSVWEKVADNIINTYSFSDFVETMVSDEVDSKIDNLDLSEEIDDRVESFIDNCTITINRY